MIHYVVLYVPAMTAITLADDRDHRIIKLWSPPKSLSYPYPSLDRFGRLGTLNKTEQHVTDLMEWILGTHLCRACGLEDIE